jgi:hypothetical protein
MAESGDPHTIESKLERLEEYQAPPRGEEEPDQGIRADPEADARVDINLLESEQRPGLQTSGTIETDLSKKTYTISGKDEEADPSNPHAVPPGETM